MKKLTCLLLALLAVVAHGQLISDLQVQRTVRLGTTSTGTISPAQITGDEDDYTPTGVATAFRLRLSTDASRTLTGLAAGAARELKLLVNVGSFDLVLAHADEGSDPANRFALAGASDVTLSPGAALLIEYDSTSSRWRAIGGTGSGVVAASDVTFTPAGAIAATNVQAALQELDTEKQPLDAALTALAGGSDFVQFSGPASSTKVFTLPDATATILTSNAAVTVAQGGTGRATGTTAYSLIATGTTATGAQQTLAAGATTEILVGGGASALPVWTTATGSGAPVRATSPTLVSPALGTPASGVVTNLTGTASININGTVGATTPSTGAFTTLSATGMTIGAGGSGSVSGVVIINGSDADAYGAYVSFRRNSAEKMAFGTADAVLGIGDDEGAVLGTTALNFAINGSGTVAKVSSTGLAVTGALSTTTTLTTGAPTGDSAAAYKLGTFHSASMAAAEGYLLIQVGSTVYEVHATEHFE
ncbi:MAG TPA: hypothetical protein VHN79_03585 [Lacunisphaera sp.]|nr:hypothetical protein [Lacunisphaera sp.]